MNVGEILRMKGSKVITIGSAASLHAAVELLASAGVGAALVVDGEKIAGILTERDVLREIARHFDGMEGRTVADIMTTDLIIGLPGDSLDYVMDLMTTRRIRHLPIMDGGRLAGLVSIGDVVKARSHAAEIEVRHLTDYITGKYPA